MTKTILVLAAMLLLVGCDPTPEEQAAMRQNLPAGCSLRDLGSYGSVQHVVMVICDGRRTTSLSYSQRQGKTTASLASVVVQ